MAKGSTSQSVSTEAITLLLDDLSRLGQSSGTDLDSDR